MDSGCAKQRFGTSPSLSSATPYVWGTRPLLIAGAERILAVALVAYAVCDILLTPPAGLETRDPAKLTGLGYAVLGLLFIGLALAIVALVLLFRSSRRAPIVAVVAAVLYLPAFLSEQAGLFSALRPPVAIQRVEWVQAAVAVIVIGIAAWLLRSRTARTGNN